MERRCEVVREKRALVTNSQFIMAHKKKKLSSVLSRFWIFIQTAFNKVQQYRLTLHFSHNIVFSL